MPASDLTTGSRSAGRTGGRLRRLLPAFLLVVACGVAADEPAPKFAGKAIPDPPSQGAPWTPPATKLPRSLVDATAALFELGAADPRGCDYREVDGRRLARARKDRGFVMPEKPGDAGRFAVGWDGVVRPALAVGPKADLESDVRALAVDLKKCRESPQFLEYRSTNVETGITTEHRDPISPFHDDREPAPAVPRSALTLCTLLRLGRADLAESLYAAATTWTPANARPDLTDEDIRFASLSRGWADTLYSRLIAAHCEGDDADRARRRPPARPIPEGGRGEGQGAGPDAWGTAPARSTRTRPTCAMRTSSPSCWPTRSAGPRKHRAGPSRRAGATRPRGSRP